MSTKQVDGPTSSRLSRVRLGAGIATVVLFFVGIFALVGLSSAPNDTPVVSVKSVEQFPATDPGKALQLLSASDFATPLADGDWKIVLFFEVLILAIIVCALVALGDEDDLYLGVLAIGAIAMMGAMAVPSLVGQSPRQHAANEANVSRIITWGHERYDLSLTRGEADELVTPGHTVYLESGAPVTSVRPDGSQALILTGSDKHELPRAR